VAWRGSTRGSPSCRCRAARRRSARARRARGRSPARTRPPRQGARRRRGGWIGEHRGGRPQQDPLVAAGQQRAELVAPHPVDAGRNGEDGPQCGRESLQQRVAAAWPKLFVVALEAVEVEQRQDHYQRDADGPGHAEPLGRSRANLSECAESRGFGDRMAAATGPGGSGGAPLHEALDERQRCLGDLTPPAVDRQRVAAIGNFGDLGDAVVAVLALEGRVGDGPRDGVVRPAGDE
jgi:hypothetical protein